MENTQNNDQQQPLTKKQRRELRKHEKHAAREAEKQKQHKQKMIFWGGVIAVLVIAVFGISRLTAKPIELNPDGTVLTEKIDPSQEWTKGNPNALVQLVEYSDFQCPFCAKQSPNVKRLTEEFSDGLLVVYRNFPLVGHTNAQDAAQAAEAAGIQGKFWEMHDLLFDRQKSWENIRNPKETFTSYAQELGLNVEQFEKDYDSGEVKDRINEDKKSGNVAGVTGTPAFYLNGRKLPNPETYDEFATRIREAIRDEELKQNLAPATEEQAQTEEQTTDNKLE